MSFKSILHPTDFSEKSMVAFNHALKLALEEKSKFILMYAMAEDKHTLDWDKFPKVRDTLVEWGLINEGASRKDIYEKLGVEVKKIIGKGKNIVDSVAGLINEEQVDLIVFSTHGREGIPRLLNSSISESISRKALVPTMFIPHDSKPFVSPDTGLINLNEILVPIDHKPKPQRAVDFGISMGRIYGEGKAQIHIMHVFDNNYLLSKEDLPEIKLPDNEDCIIRFEVRKNKIYEEIIRVAEEIEADLIVIATEGHNGILDALFGSTSEQVLRHSNCPVLTIPVAQGVYMPRNYETVGDKTPEN